MRFNPIDWGFWGEIQWEREGKVNFRILGWIEGESRASRLGVEKTGATRK